MILAVLSCEKTGPLYFLALRGLYFLALRGETHARRLYIQYFAGCKYNSGCYTRLYFISSPISVDCVETYGVAIIHVCIQYILHISDGEFGFPGDFNREWSHFQYSGFRVMSIANAWSFSVFVITGSQKMCIIHTDD